MDVYNILKAKGIYDEVPEVVRKLIENGLKGLIKDTPKAGDSSFHRTYNIVIANNHASLKAMEEARNLEPEVNNRYGSSRRSWW